VTTVATIEIESYYDRVRAALAGLAPEMRDDLLEDLPDHLAEVLAEGDGSLRDRLGEPEAYADELRAAAGVEPAAGPTAHGVHRALERGLGRTTDLVRRFDLQAGRLVGYPRLRDLLRAPAPGWWVLRVGSSRSSAAELTAARAGTASFPAWVATRWPGNPILIGSQVCMDGSAATAKPSAKVSPIR
jgi:hypothetical protein